MHFTCPANFFSSAFSVSKLSPWISMFSVSGSRTQLDKAGASISSRGSTLIGWSFPYHVNSSLFAIAVSSIRRICVKTHSFYKNIFISVA